MQIRKKIYWSLCVLLLAACRQSPPAPRPNPALQLREMGQLATTEYELSKVVRARDEATWYKVGERRMLVSCRARIKAGIDLSQIRDIDIKAQGDKISIKLPAPQILTFSIPPENIRVVYSDVGLFRTPFSQAETNAIMQQAEKQIRRQADSLNILQKAQEGAAVFVRNFFEQAGYKEVTVTYRYKETTFKIGY